MRFAISCLVLLVLVVASCASTPASGGTSTESSHSVATPSPSATAGLVTAIDEGVDHGPPGAIEILMTSGPNFEPDAVTAKAGTVAFFLRNEPAEGFPSVPHNFNLGPTVGEAIAHTPAVLARDAIVFTIEGLMPGTYAYWCTTPAGDRTHADLGMVGTLTVTP